MEVEEEGLMLGEHDHFPLPTLPTRVETVAVAVVVVVAAAAAAMKDTGVWEVARVVVLSSKGVVEGPAIRIFSGGGVC